MREEEVRPLGAAALFLGCLLTGHVMLETARDALFLTLLEPRLLPVASALSALVALAAIPLLSAAVRRLGLRATLVLGLRGASVLLLALVAPPVTRATALALFVASALVGSLLLAQAWVFVGAVFTVSQGRRLLPWISAGGIAGALAGAAAARLVVAVLPVWTLVLFGAVTLALASTLPNQVGVPRAPRPLAAPRSHADSVWRDRHARGLVALAAVVAATGLAVDTLFKTALAARVAPADLGAAFASSYLAFNVAALGVEVLLAPALLSRWGLVGSALVAPALFCLAGLTAAFTQATWAVFATKAVDGALRHSLVRVTAQLFAQPLPAELRVRLQPLLDGVVQRGTQMAVGLALALWFATTAGSLAGLGLVVAALAGAWALAVARLRRTHVRALREAIARGRGTSHEVVLDREWIDVLTACAAKPDPRLALLAAELLRDAGGAEDLGRVLLAHPREQVQLEGLSMMVKGSIAPDEPRLVALLRGSPSPRVRAAAVRALGVMGGDSGARSAVASALADRSIEVRAAAAVQAALSRRGSWEHEPSILALVDPPDEGPRARREARLALVAELERVSDPRAAGVLVALLSTGEPGLATHAVRPMADSRDPRFFPVLVGQLDVARHRSRVRDALVKGGAEGLAALGRALSHPATPLAVRRRIPRVAAAFRDSPHAVPAARMLASRLVFEAPGPVRSELVRALAALARAVPRDAIPGPLVRVALQAELDRALTLQVRRGTLAAHRPTVACESGNLVLAMADDELGRASERIRALLGVLLPGPELKASLRALGGADASARALGRELVDALLRGVGRAPPPLVERVALWFDDLPPAERASRAHRVLDLPHERPVAALRALARDPEPALATLAHLHAHALRDAVVRSSPIAEVTRAAA